MLNDLLLKAYGGLWTVASPLLRRHKRLAEGFDQRLAPPDWPGLPPKTAQGGPRVWLQAASGGEARLVHSLLPAFTDLLLQAAPPVLTGGPGTPEAPMTPGPAKIPATPGSPLPPPASVLCTTFTRQGLDVLRELPPRTGAVARYFPLDAPRLMARALDAAAPDLLVLLETELWPGLLDAARRRGVPVLVLNGRMTPKSFKAYSLLRPFWRNVAPARVLAVSPDDANRFAELFRCPVSVMPNIKFDGTAEAAKAPPPPSIRAEAGIPGEALLAAFASVREEEEDLLLPVIRSLAGSRAAGAPVAVAVAPRHMHRVDAWARKLGDAGVAFSRRSEKSGPAETARTVCLWDSFGELRSLYASADAAFVGGSLAPLGGQNFLEAPALGVAALVGPHTGNFLWVGDDVFATGLVRRVPDAETLADAIRGVFATRFPSGLPADAATAAHAREEAACLVRKHFLDWLGPKTGGAAQAARAMADMLLAQNRSTG